MKLKCALRTSTCKNSYQIQLQERFGVRANTLSDFLLEEIVQFLKLMHYYVIPVAVGSIKRDGVIYVN